MYRKNYEYVLITPARNEEAFIETAIQSIIAQTRLPQRWIIVSDGSNDRTEAIVRKYAERYEWIELIAMPVHSERHFASKVYSFNRGYESVKKEKYDIIGNLDADISFSKDYFEFLLKKFEENDRLGVAGTPFIENGRHYDYRFTNIEHVSGACQLFRRECFEEIGGYVPIKSGGIDWVAVTTARMRGWETRTFTEKTCLHHRKIGTGNTAAVLTWFRQGRKDYFLGNHPLWEVFRTLYQMIKKPYIIGGTFLLLGFAWAGVKRVERPISDDLVQFVRKEQMSRLKKVLAKVLSLNSKCHNVQHGS
jgi:glycosyltransferase involved in cell wall biosynthesis